MKQTNDVRQRIRQEIVKREENSRLTFAATHGVNSMCNKLGTSLRGLDADAVETKRRLFGRNEVTKKKRDSALLTFIKAFLSPFSLILVFLAIVSACTDVILPLYQQTGDADYTTLIIIVVMVLLAGILRYVEEGRSQDAAEKLLAMVTTTCAVIRRDVVDDTDVVPKTAVKTQEIPLQDLVVGDIVSLSVGDMIPADLRIIEARDFFVNQAGMTGESVPVEKVADEEKEEKDSVLEYANIAFMGTNVISGQAKGIVVAVGDQTVFGQLALALHQTPEQTSFEKGVSSVSWLLVKFMLCMVPTVFVLNGLTKGDWFNSFLFGISIAVGLTPQMLPMIVTSCLARGAVKLSKKKTIVKKLDAIQNFGSMDVLCTDKTGTITQDRVVLEYHLDLCGNEDVRVLRHAYLNSYFQTGYKNLMDVAIIEKTEEAEDANPQLADLSETYRKIDEIPFDFTRRCLSTIVENTTGKRQMVTKGAVEEMLSLCNYAEYQGKVQSLTDAVKTDILRTADDLNEDGMRVIALAQKAVPLNRDHFTVADESDMVLMGYLAFLDPPKESARQAIGALRDYGVATKVLTGDNEKVTYCICKQVGLDAQSMLLGSDIAKMDDGALAKAVETTDVFAKLEPNQKARIVKILRQNGHVVGYMGDGINDAAAMNAADIGVSVDTAADVAKEAADIILLEKDLMVLEEGVLEGRRTYGNMIKYIKITASSNFGNMFSVLAAAIFLPFLPMDSLQLLILSLMYTVSSIAIPWDCVDNEYLKKPRQWNASSIGDFMIWLGPTSSVFDWTTYLLMYFVFCPMLVSHGVLYNDLSLYYSGNALTQMQQSYVSLFQTAWFVESMWTQTLVIFMLRTKKIPFLQSWPSLALATLSLLGIVLLNVLPYTPIAAALGLVALPVLYYLVCLIPSNVLYLLLATSIKKAYCRHFGELL